MTPSRGKRVGGVTTSWVQEGAGKEEVRAENEDGQKDEHKYECREAKAKKK